MKKEIQERIEYIKNNQLPDGYRRIKDIGIAPKDWTLGKLSDVIENVQRPVSKPNEPYWRLGIKSWAKGTFHTFIDNPETVNMDELYEVKENDLIVNITFAWEHAIAIAKKEDEGLLVSHRFPTYVFKEGQVPEYYQAVITQHYFKDMLDHISPGGAGRNRVLNRKDFLNLSCVIPSREEQEKIAKVLFACDELIYYKTEYLKEMKNYKKWLMQTLLQKNRSWQKKKLSDLASIETGSADTKDRKENGKYPFFVRSANVEKIDTFSYDGEAILTPGDGNIGEIFHYIVGKFDFHQRVYKISDFSDICCGKYIYYYLQQFFKRRAMSMTAKATVDSLRRDMLTDMNISLPSIEIQKNIAEILSVADEQITICELELFYEKQKKKALSQLLLTGMVRV